ncbi:MAG: hypothetical protein H7256_08840 [Bdellovibrio sp.]|nr:hypothetical protein [Bdellovibrio sp.]
MKKSFWIFSLILIIAVVLVEFDLAQRNARTIAKQIKNGTLPVAKNSSVPTSNSNKELKSSQKIDQQLAQLAQNNLEQSDDQIQDVAKNLSNADLKKLSEVMSDKKADEDQRTLAVELISRHQTVESLKQLESFVLRPVTSSENNKRQLESVLKAQAIEGIAAYPQKDIAISSLTSLDPVVSEAFLKDRIKRSMATLQNQVEKTEKSDGDALRKLVE